MGAIGGACERISGTNQVIGDQWDELEKPSEWVGAFRLHPQLGTVENEDNWARERLGMTTAKIEYGTMGTRGAISTNGGRRNSSPQYKQRQSELELHRPRPVIEG